jgi:hypothetical protein
MAATETYEGPFYPGRFDEAEKEAFRRSPLWPMALTMHHAAEGRLYVTVYDSKGFLLSTREGFTIHRVIKEDDEFKIYNTETRLHKNGSGKPIMASNNIRYLSRRLGMADNKKLLMDKAGFKPNYMLAEAADTHADALCKREYNLISLSQDDLKVLLKLAAGTTKMEDVSSGILATIKQEHDSIIKREKMIERYKTEATEMFGRPKWVVIPRPDYGVIVGATDCTSLIACAVDEAMKGTHSPLDIINWLVPLRLYKSWDTIDPTIRDRVMGQLAFCKVHREGQGKKISCIDDKGLVPSIAYIETATNSMTWTPTHLAPWMLVDYSV